MGHDVFERNIVLMHQRSAELGGAVSGLRAAVAVVLAHFDADAVIVSGAIEVRMFALLVCRKMLDGDVFLHGEMPSEVTNAISAPALVSAELSILESTGVVPRVAAVVLRAVHGDVTRLHRTMILPTVTTLLDVAFDEIDFALELAVRYRRAAR